MSLPSNIMWLLNVHKHTNTDVGMIIYINIIYQD